MAAATDTGASRPASRGARAPVPPILLASYPRSGSTSVAAALAELHGPGARVEHEPFRTCSGPGRRPFGRDLDAVVAHADVLKHHPGNLLSDRQNRLLYGRWLERGGRIVHLRRRDVRAQARSLVIARGLNSFHRPHRVTVVPEERVVGEEAELRREVTEQARLLAEVPHVEVTLEDLLVGDERERTVRFARLLATVDPAAAAALAEDGRLSAVTRHLAPARRVAAAPDGPPVRLVDQVPLLAGVAPVLAPAEATSSSVGLGGPAAGPLFGVDARDVGPAMAGPVGRALVERMVDAVAAARRVRLEPRPTAAHLMTYDGDRWPDHDLDLWPPPVDTATPELHVSLVLDAGPDLVGGEVHLAGRGRQAGSNRPGHLCFFAAGIGARRAPVRAGRLSVLVAALPYAPGQVLCGGQLLGDAGLFVAPEEGRP